MEKSKDVKKQTWERETECVCLGVSGYEEHLILRNAI